MYQGFLHRDHKPKSSTVVCMLASRDVQGSNHTNSAHYRASEVLLAIEHGMNSETKQGIGQLERLDGTHACLTR